MTIQANIRHQVLDRVYLYLGRIDSFEGISPEITISLRYGFYMAYLLLHSFRNISQNSLVDILKIYGTR